ncbi:MAG TPA: hypothetical protein PKH29_12455 [Oscillospiraceae bacterium]|nr:hypothetical protein [Oscillospiraceae bacterium]
MYDEFGRVTETTVTGIDGAILSYETASYTDVFKFDDSGYHSVVVKTLYTGGEPITTHSIYNMYGELVAAKNALNGGHYDRFTYDLLGRKISEKTAQAEIDYPEIAYTAKWDYDFRGNVVKEYNAEGYYITYAYDGIGRKISVTDYSNNTTTFTYDNLGRELTQSVPFEVINSVTYYAVTKTDYDRNGNVTQTRVANNEPGAAADWSKTTNEYNNRNFLTTATNYLDNTSENVVTYTYNGAGSVLTQTTGTHTIEYTYDRYQNAETLEDALSQTEEYAYTPNGSLLSKTDRNGTDFTYGVDGLGRTLTIGASGSGQQCYCKKRISQDALLFLS